MKSSRLRTVIVCVIAILVGIFVIAGAVVVTTSERYFKDHYAARNPPWVSDFSERQSVSGPIPRATIQRGNDSVFLSARSGIRAVGHRLLRTHQILLRL